MNALQNEDHMDESNKHRLPDTLLSFKLTGSEQLYGDQRQGDVKYRLHCYGDMIGTAKKNLVRMMVAAIRGNLEEYFAEDEHFVIENHDDVLCNETNVHILYFPFRDCTEKDIIVKVKNEQEIMNAIASELPKLKYGDMMTISVWDCQLDVRMRHFK